MNRITKYFKWFFKPQGRPLYPSNMERIKKLKKRVKDLEFRVGSLENELMIIMKEHRHLINSLEMRIDILDEGCGKCTKN